MTANHTAISCAGFAIVESAIEDRMVAELQSRFEMAVACESSLNRHGSTFALRNLLRDHPMRIASPAGVAGVVNIDVPELLTRRFASICIIKSRHKPRAN